MVLEEPRSYHLGVGAEELMSPRNVILFRRTTKKTLQQEALQNRSHHRLVLISNYETEGTVHLDSLSLLFRPGQSLLIFPHQFHHFTNLASRDLNWLFCTFELTSFQELEALRNRVLEINEESEGVFKALVRHWKNRQSELTQISLRYVLGCLTSSIEAGEPFSLAEQGSDLLNRVNRRIAAKGDSSLLISRLAEQLGYSESRLRVLFREEAGVPLGTYIRNCSLNQAMSLLKGTNFTVAEVAAASGFGSVQSFCRVFKKETGMTALAYRGGKVLDLAEPL